MYDALIIGAGAAGLEAARVLGKAGLRFRILEARSVVGGRIRTKGIDPEVELGAEFLHGDSRLTKRRLEEFGLGYRDLKPRFHVFENGRLHAAPGYWKTLAHAFSHLRTRHPDRPFSDFASNSKLTPSERLLASAFVEGFDAADLERISANSLVGTARWANDPAQRALGRPVEGYSTLIGAMARGLEDAIQLRTVVNAIEWKRGSVTVRAEGPGGPKIYSALAAVVTVPIGVLKTPAGAPGGIRFSPKIPGLERALAKIEMGQVVRVTLEFAPEIRSLIVAKFPDGFPFISSPELPFMTWWGNQVDDRPLITAWAGGAHATRIASWTLLHRLEVALANLADLIGVRESTLAHGLRHAYHHDWASDPYARGAYSYPGLESEGASEHLQRSAAKTIYFAGEALEPEYVGTVEGALRSGRRQARKVVATLGTRPIAASVILTDVNPASLQ